MLVKFLGQRYSEKNSKFKKNRLTMLFWHLLGRENAHIRQVCSAFRSVAASKLLLLYNFCGVLLGENLSSVAAGVARLRATPPKIQAKA